jgi:malate dehydrogenase (quinone)
LAAILGASPGASTAVSIVLEALEKCFPAAMQSEGWKSQLAQMVPAYGMALAEHPDAFKHLRSTAHALLQLDKTKQHSPARAAVATS